MVRSGTVRATVKYIEMSQYHRPSFNRQALSSIRPAELRNVRAVSLRSFRINRICRAGDRCRVPRDATPDQRVRGVQLGIIREVSKKHQSVRWQRLQLRTHMWHTIVCVGVARIRTGSVAVSP